MKLKKIIFVLLGAAVILGSAVSAFGSEGYIISGRTLVPVRGVFEELGFTVNWDPEINKASISDNTHEVSVIKGLSYFKADGKEFYPDVPQTLIDGRLYLPLRAIGDAIGAETDWDPVGRIARIKYKDKFAYVECKANTANMKKYNGTDVPDFGSVFGATAIKAESTSSGDTPIYTYYYNYSEIDHLTEYEGYLRDTGYFVDITLTSRMNSYHDNSDKNVVFRKDSDIVVLRQSPDNYQIVIGISRMKNW